MRKAAVITLFLLFFLFSGKEFIGSVLFPVTLTLIEKIPINNSAQLYVVEADVNATTPPSYRYYLADRRTSQADFLASIQESDDYFLQTREKARVEVREGGLFLSTTGTVYKFTNSGGYRVGSHLFYVKVALSAEPE